MQTQAVEDYLKTIFELQTERGKAATTVLAQRLGVAPASATVMIKKLAAARLVTHRPYQGVVLTASGEKIALEVLRHHRLVERFLAESLGVPWDEVHAEAERWEHVLSEELEDRMDAVLGHPTTDPHGSPIPTSDGAVPRRAALTLAELEPGQGAVVAEVADEDPELLRYLGRLGLYPGAELAVVAAAPFEGPLTVQVGRAEHPLGRETARRVRVEVTSR